MLLKVPAQILRGFCMGTADIVPGVSGGTIALVLGIYERLVHTVREGAVALARLVRLDLRGGLGRLARVDWAFLLPLLAGILAAVLVLSHTIERLLAERPVEVAATFFGLVAASIAVAWGYVRRWDPARGVVLLATALATFALLGLRGGRIDRPGLWMVFAAGALAVCAMILPGVSGSFILLMVGMYDTVLGSVNQRDLVVLAVFALGCVIGLAVFSSVLDWLLRHHHDTVMAALVGIMAGSLRVLWPWPDGTAGTRLALPAAGNWFVPVALAVVGAVVVLGIAGLSSTRSAGTRTATRA